MMYCQGKSTNIVPLVVQQLVTGAVLLKGQLYLQNVPFKNNISITTTMLMCEC